MRQLIPLISLSWPYVLALVWGIAWAIVLQWTQIGRFLAVRRTWITVVVGVGVDLLLVLVVIPLQWWLRVGLIVVLSSLGIIARSLINEHREEQEAIHAAKAEIKEHDDLGA